MVPGEGRSQEEGEWGKGKKKKKKKMTTQSAAYKSAVENSRERRRQLDELLIPFHIDLHHPIPLLPQTPKHEPIPPLQAHQRRRPKVSDRSLHLVELGRRVHEIGPSRSSTL